MSGSISILSTVEIVFSCCLATLYNGIRNRNAVSSRLSSFCKGLRFVYKDFLSSPVTDYTFVNEESDYVRIK